MRHHGDDVVTALLQAADDLDRFVRSNSAADTYSDT
jgi:hypothetical protein